MKRRTKVGLVVAGLIGFFVLPLWTVLRTTYGVGVDSVSWLPREARNITYFRNDLTWMAEFDIEREAFEAWCAKRKMPLQELDGGGYHAVDRCVPMLERMGLIPAIDRPYDMEREQQKMERVVKVFRAGDLFYEERWDNGGGHTLGYDVKAERGYFRYSHH